MPSQTDICNMALGRIGQGTITAMDDGSHAANLCQIAFPVLLWSLLDDYPWNFAKTRQELAQDAAPPVSGFAHAYTLPPDCVRVRQLNGDDKLVWKVEKGKLLTDESTAKILFTAYVDDPNKFRGKFAESFWSRLAAHLAGPLTGNQKLALELLQECSQILLPDAKAIDGQEGSEDQLESTALTDDVRDG